MSRPYTGKVITRQAEVKQKNGDVYVYERTYQYNREKRRTMTLSNRLIGKKVAGSDEIVPTSHKSSESEQTTGNLVSLRSPHKQSNHNEDAKTASAASLQIDHTQEKDIGRIDKNDASLGELAGSVSRLREAFESCCGHEFASRLLACLWREVLGDSDPCEIKSVQEQLELQSGIMETLCLLRSSADSEAFWIACISSSRIPAAEFTEGESEKRVLMIDSDGTTLGLLTLDPDLDPVFELERIFDGVIRPLGCLIVREQPISDRGSIRKVMGSSQPFLARAFLEPFASGADLTAFLWQDELIECRTATVSSENAFDSHETSSQELTAHSFSRPREKAACLEALYRKVHRVLALLLEGIMPDELSSEAKTLQDEFLIHRRDNVYELNDDRVHEEADRLSCVEVVTNARMEPEKAFSWYMSAQDFQEESEGLESGDATFRVLRDMLEEAASQLVERAADLGKTVILHGRGNSGEDATMRMVVTARLENASLKELDRIISRPESPVEKRVKSLLLEAFDSQKNK